MMESIPWIRIDGSSLVSGYRFDREKNIVDLTFKSNGAKYRYFDVSERIIDSIPKDDSEKGSFFKSKLIKGPHRYERI